MDPITITAVLASKAVIGAIGAATTALGFSSIVNSFTAKKNRKHQQDLQFANQDFQREILAKQQAFADARDKRQFNKAAELQREIVALQHKNAVELQNSSFAQQRARDSYKRFCENVWPLLADPDYYVNYLKRSYSENMMPLQVIVPATMPKDSFAGIDNPLTTFLMMSILPVPEYLHFTIIRGGKTPCMD